MRCLLVLTAAAIFAAPPLVVRADAAGDVTAAADRFAHLHSWHADENLKTMTVHVDFAAPDRFRMAMPMGTQYIVGSTLYITTGGRTMKIDSPRTASMIAMFKSPAHAAAFTKSHGVKDAGPSSVDGVATHAYAFDDTSYGVSSHNILDIGVQDGLPHRMTQTSKNGSATIKYSRFNVPVTINPPI